MTNSEKELAKALGENLEQVMEGWHGMDRYSREYRVLKQKEDDLRAELVELFAKVRGWRLSNKGFNMDTLARRKMHSPRRHSMYHDRNLEFPLFKSAIDFDHPYWFRTPDRRAAGVAYHGYNLLYPWPGVGGPEATRGCEARVKRWALMNGLCAEFPDDFPSWWYPGATRLVVLTPGTVRLIQGKPLAGFAGQGQLLNGGY